MTQRRLQSFGFITMCIAAALWSACGDDTDSDSDSGSSSSSGSTSSSSSAGTGGSGGTSTTTTSTTTSTSGTGGMGGASSGAGGGTVCDQACNHVEVDCGLTGACALAAQQLGLDLNCGGAQDQCVATCIVNADCAAIISLAGQNPDPALSACANGC